MSYNNETNRDTVKAFAKERGIVTFQDALDEKIVFSVLEAIGAAPEGCEDGGIFEPHLYTHEQQENAWELIGAVLPLYTQRQQDDATEMIGAALPKTASFKERHLNECYVVTVQYVRYYAEDSEMLTEKFPGLSHKEAAVKQLREELQDAADERGVAGLFNVGPCLEVFDPGHAEAVEAVLEGVGWDK